MRPHMQQAKMHMTRGETIESMLNAVNSKFKLPDVELMMSTMDHLQQAYLRDDPSKVIFESNGSGRRRRLVFSSLFQKRISPFFRFAGDYGGVRCLCKCRFWDLRRACGRKLSELTALTARPSWWHIACKWTRAL